MASTRATRKSCRLLLPWQHRLVPMERRGTCYKCPWASSTAKRCGEASVLSLSNAPCAATWCPCSPATVALYLQACMGTGTQPLSASAETGSNACWAPSCTLYNREQHLDGSRFPGVRVCFYFQPCSAKHCTFRTQAVGDTCRLNTYMRHELTCLFHIWQSTAYATAGCAAR